MDFQSSRPTLSIPAFPVTDQIKARWKHRAFSLTIAISSSVYYVTREIGMEGNGRKLIQMLERDGWRLASVEGDHHNFKHPEKSGKVTVTHPRKDIPIGTVLSIYRQAGWSKSKS